MHPILNSALPSMETLKENKVQHTDVYRMNAYARLYEEKEQGEALTVYHESSLGKVEYTFLKRAIPFLVDGKQYFDLITAYGYGGPHLIESSNPPLLMEEFYKEFHLYCLQNMIVSEFVRFHLFENEAVKNTFPGEVQFISQNVVRDLTQPLELGFHKSIGTSVRKSIGNGVTVSFDTTGKFLPQFLSIYHQTMDRNDATGFYYFEDDFFKRLHQSLKGNFLYANAMVDEKVISSFLTIIGEECAYGFLGGTLREYFSYNSATLLEYETIGWLKEKGLKYYVLGGGYGGDDGIYKFKKKFSLQDDNPFYIGKKIHNQEIYQQLVDIRYAEEGLNKGSTFFPLYRLG